MPIRHVELNFNGNMPKLLSIYLYNLFQLPRIVREMIANENNFN